jgi:predicted 3-demethylubiquinone-9 3-methyltransferase (glyoxalase superfamily)
MITARTCLWFDDCAEEAARFYVSLVPGSALTAVTPAPEAWPGGVGGAVITVEFTLAGQAYQGLNGGARADYGMAASISLTCETQGEIDRLWTSLLADGGEEIMCGWLRDRFGVPWQIVPEALPRLLAQPDRAAAARAFAAMQGMVKLDGAALECAAAG